MKKILSFILVTVLLMCNFTISSYAAESIRLEAESATSDWRVRDNSSASNQKAAQVAIGSSGSWSVEITQSGMYSISAFYATNGTNVRATLNLGEEKICESVVVPTTGSNGISSAVSIEFAKDYALKEGIYTLSFEITGAQILLDYIDIIKTGDYSGNSLNGDTEISALKYESSEKTQKDNSILNFIEGSSALYQISSKEECVYGVKLNAFGTAAIRLLVNGENVYEGEFQPDELFSYKFTDISSDIELEVISGSLAVESILFSQKKSDDIQAEADYRKYEIEASEEYHFENGVNKNNVGFGVNLNDWFDYYVDVSTLGAGEYKMTLRYATAGTVGVVFAADSGDTLEANVYSTGSFTTYKVAELGTINIGSEKDKLRLTISTSSGMMADWFSLEKVDVTPSLKFISVGGDIPAVNNKVLRSADYVDAVFSYYIDSESVTNDNMKIMCGDKKLDTEFEVKDTVVRLKLKESLDYNTKYSVVIGEGIKGVNEKDALLLNDIYFETSESDDVKNIGSIAVENCTNDYENFKISGIVLSSVKNGISGRNVWITAQDKYGENIEIVGSETMSGINGSFECVFSLPEKTDSGEISFCVSADYSKDEEFTSPYISKSFESDILNKIFLTTTSSEAMRVFSDNETLLKINVFDDTDGIENPVGLFERFVGREFVSLSILMEEYKRCITFHEAKGTYLAQSYSLIKDGSFNKGELTLFCGGEVSFNFNILSSDYYVIRLNVTDASNAQAEIYLDDALISSPYIPKGISTVSTINAEAGKTVLKIKNTSSQPLSFDSINVSKADKAEAKKGFGSVKVLGANFRDGEGVGHFFLNGRNVTGTHVGINKGDWFYYDFDTAGTGEYKVTFQYTSPRATDVTYTDADGEQFTFELPTTGSWSTTKVYEAGTIKLKGDTTWLYLTSVAGLSLHHVIFERTDAPMSYYTTIANDVQISDNSLIKRGTDEFDIHFTAIPSSVNASNIKLKKDGKIVSCDYEINENVISVKLKETLEYNSEYILEISGIISTTGQEFPQKTIVPIKTGDKSSDSGIDKAKVTEKSINYENVVLKGVVKSSCDTPISGRKVTFSAYDLNGKEILLSNNSVLSGENGEFSANLTIPEGIEFGNISFNVTSEYGFIPDQVVLSYISEQKEISICEELQKTKNEADVINFFDSYKKMLDINIDEDIKGISDEKTAFYESFIGKVCSDAEEIKKAYKAAIIKEKINGAANVRELMGFFDNTYYIPYLEALGVSTDLYSEITNQKSTLLSEILALPSMSVNKDLMGKCNEIIKKYFLKEYGKEKVTLIINGSSVYAGQSALLETGFNSLISDVVSLELELIANGSGLFNNATSSGTLSLASDGKTLTYKKSHNKTAVSKMDTINLVTPYFPGIYNISVSGKVEYEITAKSGKVYIVEDETEKKTVVLTIVQIPSASVGDTSRPTSGGSFSGGSSGGSSSGGTSSQPSQNVSTPVVTPEDNTKYEFTDLENSKWAEESIYYLLSIGVISESENKCFNPLNNIKREEFVKMIVSAFGLYDSLSVTNLNDVPKDTWYYGYVASAEKYGIIVGDTLGNFGAGNEITRQDMAVMMQRVLEKMGYSDTDSTTAEFSDYKDISDYAKKAVVNMQNLGILNGMGNNMFMPKNTATRAQAAKVIYMIMKLLGR